MFQKYLEKSLSLAKDSYSKGDYPIGALLVVDDNIHIEGQNKVVTEGEHRYHAEIDIINKAGYYRGNSNKKALFVTMEPCNNCAKALVDYGVGEVYYILEDPAWGGSEILRLAGVKVEQTKYKYDEYLDLVIQFMQNHGGYNEALAQYLSIKSDGENTYEIQLDKIIEHNFINISQDLPDYIVRKIIYNNTLAYLKNALLRTPQDKHEIIFQGYHNDMERIISYCSIECINKIDFVLSTNFIKGLHKMLYPAGHIQKQVNEKGQEIIWMIPGEYRIINLESTTNPNKKIYCNFENIKDSLDNIIAEFNNNLNSNNSQKSILIFMADFSRVHPFGDGNGRLIDILVDLLLVKNNLTPIYFGKLKQNDKVSFYQALDGAHETRKLDGLLELVDKYSK